MSQHANNANVSRLAIESVLARYGAQNYAYAIMPGATHISFSMNGRTVKFVLPLPKIEEFALTPTGRKRTKNSRYNAWVQACRQRRRALKLVIQTMEEATNE